MMPNRVALVTGAARMRGIGFAVAEVLAANGMSVALADLSPQVRDAEASLTSKGHTARAFRADLSKLDEAKAIAGELVREFGQIDALVNVAGGSIPPRPAFLEMSEAYWDQVMDRNLRTTVNCCWAVLPTMMAQRAGRVVNVSSITARFVYRHSAAYAAAKAAIGALGRALALEMGEYNITVNTILPGDIDTADTPSNPADRRDLGALAPSLATPISSPGLPTDVAELVRFLVLTDTKFITGTEIMVDGGASIVEPYLVEKTFSHKLRGDG
ncbi:MAG TPA: SDR family NAD(P)-dependent oxidoreductase [Terriglobales bacterium]|nr:SDR family NAD(P)-dependent oxidoreductase [Terriglobales bacterium]